MTAKKLFNIYTHRHDTKHFVFVANTKEFHLAKLFKPSSIFAARPVSVEHLIYFRVGLCPYL